MPWLLDLGYVLFTIVLFQEVFFGGARFIARDLLHYFYPIGTSLARAWEGAGSFWWDSGIEHGIPMAARWSPAVFYPAHWFFAVLRVDLAIAAAILVHFPIAASAMMRLARRYTTSIAAAWVGGLAYAFGGYLLSMVGGGTYLYGAALLPLAILAFHRLAERPDLGRVLQLALVLALQVLIPDPQTLFFEVIFCAPLILYLHAEGRNERRRALIGAAVSGILALGLSFCQLWPTIELASHSVRAGGFDHAQATLWSFHPLRLLEVAVPNIYGGPLPENTYWARSLVNNEFAIPWAAGVHVGLLPLAGLLALTWKSQRRPVLLWGGIAALFLVLAMGKWTPLYKALLAVPGVDNFRYPEKLMLFVTLGVTLLGVMGLSRIFSADAPGPGGRSHAIRRLSIGLFVLAAALLVLRLAIGLENDWFTALVTSQGSGVETKRALAETSFGLSRSLGVVVALAVVIVLRRRMRPSLVIGLLLVITAADLLTAGLPLRLLGGMEWLDERPAVCSALAPGEKGLLPFIWRDGPPRLEYRETTGAADPDRLVERSRRWEMHTLKPNVGTAYCARYVIGYDAGVLAQHQRLMDVLRPDPNAQGCANPDRLIDAFGVRYLLAPPGVLDSTRIVTSYPALGVAVYEHNGLPFAYAVSSVSVASDGTSAIQRLADPGFSLWNSAVFESPAQLPDHTRRSRKVRVRSYRPGRIELASTFPAPGYLVVLESHYPGWEATIDGHSARLYRANGAFLGLAVPAGEHRISLAFDPPRQRLANTTSLATCVTVVVLFAAGRLVRRRKRRNTR